MYQGIPPVPDSNFVRSLREFDSKLRVQFDRAHERFIITRQRAYGDDFVVWIVQTDSGEFRQPDQRDLKVLYAADLWRHGGVKKRVIDGEHKMLEAEGKEDAARAAEFRDIAKDNKIQLSNTYRKAFNMGSKAPEIRRVDVKNKGLTLAEISAARAAGQDPWAGHSKVN